ncbi:MAG TPA: PIG-L family deacetylase [Allosphingosinicella sp.]|jgi:hypothetical protein
MNSDLYLLAHPDDELFLMPLLRNVEVKHRIVFLTNGQVKGGPPPSKRQGEVRRALADFPGVEVTWLGIESQIDVYDLINRLDVAFRGLCAIAAQPDPIRRILTHAWEGGHPDHDAAHLLAQQLAGQLGIRDPSASLPYYRAPRRGPVPFLVMSPLTENGQATTIRISWREAVRTISKTLNYPSQLVPLLGLAPGLLLQLLVRRRLHLQSLSGSLWPARPTKGKLLYEKRNGLSFPQFDAAQQTFFVTINKDRNQ